ncbi:exodeoxyribonuclease VII small subunit [Hymenobacter sp. BRD128]|nr:exodeoxyribonuclease VII small subunit [Hymenobacter sp. BRD128]
MIFNSKNVTYNEAIQELETILRSLETDQVDVDDLTARAERSAELIRLCRHKLRHAEASLDRVFDSLDEDEEDLDTEEDEEADDDEEDSDEPNDYQPGGPGRPAQPRLF